VAGRSKARVFGLAGIAVSNPAEGNICVCCECCMLLGRGLCDVLITRPGESYRLWCILMYDKETSRMRRPWPALGCGARNEKTPWIRVLPEKLTDPQLLKKFPEFYGNRRFITVFTTARHLSLPRDRSIQSMAPQPISRRTILMLSFHLRRYSKYMNILSHICKLNFNKQDDITTKGLWTCKLYKFFFSLAYYSSLNLF
jgi:hypothetical protein